MTSASLRNTTNEFKITKTWEPAILAEKKGKEIFA